jgi:hypothetical protein
MKNLKIFCVFFISLLLFLSGCTEKEPLTPNANYSTEIESAEFQKCFGGRGQVTVMTWNIYVGANVDIVLEATDLFDLAVKVAAAYDTLQLTNFPERAEAIARQVAKKRPHLIGLQEVSLIQRFSTFPPDPTSFMEQTNFLDILLNALDMKGLNYVFADSIQDIDVYVPMFAGGTPTEPILHTVRLLDADVILVRGDVDFTNVVKDNYVARLDVPNLGITIPRGYVSVEAKVNKKLYRFVNTHLESFTELVRLPQAQELVETFANEPYPVIMVGDFNTLDPAPPVPFNDATCQLLTSFYEDIWVHNLYWKRGGGMTAPHDSDLRNPYPNLYQRIDLILVGNYGCPAGRHLIGPVWAEVIGDELKDRTITGMWPSDHAGVVAKLHMPYHPPFRFVGK